MKTSNPTAPTTGQGAAETIQKEQSQASGKAKARYPHTPLGPSQKNGEAGR